MKKHLLALGLTILSNYAFAVHDIRSRPLITSQGAQVASIQIKDNHAYIGYAIDSINCDPQIEHSLLEKYDLSTMTKSIIYKSSDACGKFVKDFTTDEDSVYFLYENANRAKFSLKKTTLDGQNIETLQEGNGIRNGIAQNYDYVFFVHGTEIKRYNKNSNIIDVFYRQVGNKTILGSDETHLFFLEHPIRGVMTDSKIMSADIYNLGFGNIKQIASKTIQFEVSGFSVDQQNIYWTEIRHSNDSTIYRAPRSGIGSKTVFFQADSSQKIGSLQQKNHKLYWMMYSTQGTTQPSGQIMSKMTTAPSTITQESGILNSVHINSNLSLSEDKLYWIQQTQQNNFRIFFANL